MFGANYFGEVTFGESFVDYFLDVSVFDSSLVFEGDTVVDQSQVTELAQISMPLPDLNVNDSSTTTESTTVHIPINANVFDSTTVTDFPGFYPDLVIVTEFIAFLTITTWIVNVFDAVSTAEFTNVDLFDLQKVNDTVTTAENVSIALTIPNIVVSDSTTTSDSASITQVLGTISVFDSVTATDSVSENVPIGQAVFDAVTTSEFSSVVLGQNILVLEIPVVTSESLSIRFPIEEGNLIQIDTLDS